MAAPLARAFAAPACAPFHESRCRDWKRERQAETNPTAGVRERRTEHPRRKRASKIRTETAKVRNVPESRGNARAGKGKIIALLVPCPLLPVPGGNLSKLHSRGPKSVSGVPRCHFPDTLCMKRVYKVKKALFTGVGNRQILDPFGLIGLLTGSGGLRPPRICCPRYR